VSGDSAIRWEFPELALREDSSPADISLLDGTLGVKGLVVKPERMV